MPREVTLSLHSSDDNARWDTKSARELNDCPSAVEFLEQTSFRPWNEDVCGEPVGLRFKFAVRDPTLLRRGRAGVTDINPVSCSQHH